MISVAKNSVHKTFKEAPNMEFHVYLEDFDIGNPFKTLVLELILKFGQNSRGHIPYHDKLSRFF